MKRIQAVTELFLLAQKNGHVKERYLGMSAEQFQEELIGALYRKREEKISPHDGMT